ncbi:MAG: hypothetical protein ABH823_01680 [bacterium]
MIVAIDPGKDKCGLAVLDNQAAVLERQVIPTQNLAQILPDLAAKYPITTLIIGKSASGKNLEKAISRLDLNINLFFVNEKNSTLEARKRYWRENKAKGWHKIIPASLRIPPVLIDDYAATILGERYLQG